LRNLITGINGFAASHLTNLLLENGEEVFGLGRSLENNQKTGSLSGKIKTFSCDMRDSTQLEKVIAEIGPKRIYHLASVSNPSEAAKDFKTTFETNALGALNLFEAVKLNKISPRIISVGSSQEYGIVRQEEMPISEDVAVKPVSPYGISKAYVGMLAQLFFFRDKLEVIHVRPFNHTGPGQAEKYVCSEFAKKIAEEELKENPKIEVGNLKVERDFTDVRDTVQAYYSLMTSGEPGNAYNVCSGKLVSINEILSILKKIAKREVVAVEKSELFRENEQEKYYGKCDFLTQQTGWKPKIPLKQTLSDLLEYWRRKIQVKKTYNH
jgi:GDP-4-dehydro-6-deoxy-D-mannose reductase